MHLSPFIRIAAVAAAALSLTLNVQAHDRRERGPLTVKIIGFNDFHGNLQSPGTFGENTKSELRQFEREACRSCC